jgi:hypothetical protein
VTVDVLGAAVTVRVAVVVVSSRIGDREGFSVADGANVGLGGANDSSVGRLDESTELGLVGVGLGISGRAADLVGVGRDTVGVSSWLAERDGDAGPSMFPPPAHDVSTATATAKPAIVTTSVPTPPPDPALLPTLPPRYNHCLKLDKLRPRYRRHIVASFGLSHIGTAQPAYLLGSTILAQLVADLFETVPMVGVGESPGSGRRWLPDVRLVWLWV